MVCWARIVCYCRCWKEGIDVVVGCVFLVVCDGLFDMLGFWRWLNKLMINSGFMKVVYSFELWKLVWL